MKKLLWLLFLLPCAASAQTPVEINPPQPFGSFAVCAFPEAGFPCINKTTIYADAGLTTPINQPVSLGVSGSIIFYVVSGAAYRLQVYGDIQRQYIIYGLGGTGGGSVICNTTPGSLQYNNAGFFGCMPDFIYNGSHTLTIGAAGVLTLNAGATVNGITAVMIPTLNQSTTGNAATATALATTPTLCPTGQAPTGVNASGNAQACASINSGLTLQTNGSANASQSLLDFITSTDNSVGLTVTPVNLSGGVQRFEVTGATYSGKSATTTALAATPTACNGTTQFAYGIAASGNALCAAPSGSGTTVTIASGTATLGTTAISSGACASTVTVAGSGVLTTDDITADFNANPTGTIGYAPSSNGMLTIIKWPTAGDVNFAVCNNTASTITPGAITLNWRVVR